MQRAVVYSLILAGLALAGCNSTMAPVEDRNRPASTARATVEASQRAPGPGEYYVRRGDTLYSIAWRQGFDFRGLAAANGISAPYTIYPGQKILLREATPPPKTTAPAAAEQRTVITRPPPEPAPASSDSRQPAPTATDTTAESGTGTVASGAAVTKKSPASSTNERPAPASSRPAPAPGAPVSRWRWPAEGQVIRRFSATVHKGIDIGGHRGEPVLAVADGAVVYAGTGIVGFGELLIVKHNDTYLSAYGHNDRLLVGEGTVVRAGQKIAEKGSSGTDTVKLHFEIRKEGKPVDPLGLLPHR